jgi:exosortase
MSVTAPRYLWKPAAIAAALAFLYFVTLAKLGHDWWTDENYSHGLLIPLIIGYILWNERARLGRVLTRPSLLWGGAFIAFAMLALWAGTAGAELYLQRLSLVLMLAGIVVYFWGFALLRLLLVPLGLLLLAIPIPAIIFNKIAFPLQLFDIPVLRQGNVIELYPLNSHETKKLEVVEACSGIRSLMTLLTLAVVFAYFTHPKRDDKDGRNNGAGGSNNDSSLLNAMRHYPFWRSAILVASAVPIAILTNALRVSGTGILSRYYGTQVADGFFHSFSGWVVYVVAFLLLFAVGWALDLVGARGGKGKGKGPGAAVAPEVKASKEEALSLKTTKGNAPVGVMPVKGVD